ncbi:MAG: hypothetical protein ABIH11_02000 [Candidatus Altiarchaeota archaeon]
MFVISGVYGGLCNHLVNFSHVIVSALEGNRRVMHLDFRDYAQHFQGTRGGIVSTYPPKKSILYSNRIITNILSFLLGIILNRFGRGRFKLKYFKAYEIQYGDYVLLDSPEFLDSTREAKIVFFRGYAFVVNSDKLIEKHGDAVRAYFTPIEEHQSNVSDLISRARKSCEILVGVHIRQKDYQSFLNGKFFYGLDTYKLLMKKTRELFKGSEVGFLICSDEDLDLGQLSEFNVTLARGHAIEDLYSLAKCDYIIGPPSTYSAWASFYGKVPLHMVKEPSTNFSLDDFRVEMLFIGPHPPDFPDFTRFYKK